MSERDKQKKYESDSNIEGSMYARVNAGGNAKYDTTNKKEKKSNSLSRTLLFYILGFIISIIFIFIGLWLFHDHFYNGGMNQVKPTLILLLSSFSIGFLSSKIIIKKIT